MPETRAAPKVSIGLPVYNGERYVAQAIESILAQTYQNFELIISDNASTDRTEEICRRYAEHDSRVHYHRQSQNLGAAPNFNRVFELSNGSKYFKWAAHDDWIAPTYVEECVRALESDPDAVVCQSLVGLVDAEGRHLQTFNHFAAGAARGRQSDRFRAILKDLRRCFDVFGVIRRDTLATTGLIGSHQGGDRTLLLELALHGRFALVPHCLFFNRDHGERFIRRKHRPQDELAWYTASEGARRAPCRTWTLYAACFRMIRDRVADRAEGLRCYSHLLRSVLGRRRWKRLLLEPVIALHPRLHHAYLKHKHPVGGSRTQLFSRLD